MNTISNAVIFFDIGNTLASVRVSATENRIEELRVFPDAPPVLEELRQHGARLGILSDRGRIPEDNVNESLARAGLLGYFERELILYGAKDTPRLFEQAAVIVRRLNVEGNDAQSTLLFVGEDATERAQALAAEFLVAPHPRLALAVLRQQGPLRFLRIGVPAAAASADWRAVLRPLPLAPLRLAKSLPGEPANLALYAIADTQTAAELDDLGFWVDRLGAEDEPLTSDLYILRDDRQVASGFLVPLGNSLDIFRSPHAARRVITSTYEGLFVTIPAGRSVESYHFPDSMHGHNLKLVAAPSLLESPEPGDNTRLADTVAATPELLSLAEAGTFEAALAPVLTTAEKQSLQRHITTTQIAGHIERYTGIRPVAGSSLIHSRHIHHPGNTQAVNALAEDLASMATGRLFVRTHRFTHEGRPYDNVEAILPKAGRDGVVLISAHMDSTGARSPGYRASIDPAPGADDDASGIAGVLSAAQALLALDATRDLPRREIRFVLFNAEEHGLIGSRAYAQEQARIGAPIVAVFQLDMIGYDVIPARAFELHAGYSASATVQSRSLRLTALIAALVPQISDSLPAPQIYPGDGRTGDPAEERSDHYSFQVEGYAACLASEDLFVGPSPSAPAPEPNPNYHLTVDNAVNAQYAADIARAVAAAAWVTATR